MDPKRNFGTTMPIDELVFRLPLVLMTSIPVRFVSRKYNCVFPQNLFLLIIAIVVGIVVAALTKDYSEIPRLPPADTLGVFLPIFIIATMYRIDYYVFIRCLPQAIIISTFGVIVNIIMLGFTLVNILHQNWPWMMGLVAAAICTPLQPNNVIFVLKELAKRNYLGTMLEAEMVLSLVLVTITHSNFVGLMEGVIQTPLQLCISIAVDLIGGLIFGCLSGKLLSLFMFWLYNEPLNSLSITIGMGYLTYYTAEYVLGTSGILSVVCLASFMAAGKHKLSAEVDGYLNNFWGTLAYLAEVATFMFSVMDIIAYLYYHIHLTEVYGTIMTYFSGTIVRIFLFIVMGFVLKKMTYELNIRCLIVMGYGGIKGSINLLFALDLLTHKSTRLLVDGFLLDILVYTFLTLLINSTSMRFKLHIIGLAELSDTRKKNMTSCMKFIMDKRICIINILKLNKYLSDANWAMVRGETVIKHPYKIKMVDDGEIEEEDEDYLWNSSIAVCPDCLKEVPFEIPDKDAAEMIKEAQVKILKAKKISVIKQYENGTINKNCMQVLIHIFETMIESNPKNNVVNVKPYLKKSRFLMFVIHILMKLERHKTIEAPKTPCRRLCFYIMMHVAYEYVYFVVVFLNASILIEVIIMHPTHRTFAEAACVFFWFIFFVDVIIKMIGYSKKESKTHRTYFFYFWNRFDFFFTIVNFMNLIIVFWLKFNVFHIRVLGPIAYFMIILGSLRILKLFYLLQPLYPKILVSIQYKVDSKICFGYDLATALVNCCEELLDVISKIIEVKVIRDVYVENLHTERQALIVLMEQVQEERPWISITVKTKQAIRTTLSAMVDALNELKVSGFVDTIEYEFISKEIAVKQKFLHNMKFVDPSPPKVIFHEVPWMADNEELIEYLYNNVHTVSWNAGETVCKDGRYPSGVYIVVTGLLRLKYDPKPSTLENINYFGSIPVVDYLSTLRFDTPFNDNIMSGNSFGELSVLTGRPYDCTIVADSHCQAYLLTCEVIKEAMKLSKDPVQGLEARMWKCTTINLAVAVLMDVPIYQSFTQEQIKFKLERAFAPNLKCYKMFVVTEMMDDIVLLEGVVADYNTGEIYTAPMLIPRTIQKLILPMSSYLAFESHVETRLLIIPMGEAKEYDIMEFEEEIAELVSLPDSKCLLHPVQDQQKRKRSIKKKVDKASMLTKESVNSMKNGRSRIQVLNLDINERTPAVSGVRISKSSNSKEDEISKKKSKASDSPA